MCRAWISSDCQKRLKRRGVGGEIPLLLISFYLFRSDQKVTQNEHKTICFAPHTHTEKYTPPQSDTAQNTFGCHLTPQTTHSHLPRTTDTAHKKHSHMSAPPKNTFTHVPVAKKLVPHMLKTHQQPNTRLFGSPPNTRPRFRGKLRSGLE